MPQSSKANTIIKSVNDIDVTRKIEIKQRERRAVIKEIRREMEERTDWFETIINGERVRILSIALYRLEGILYEVLHRYDR